MASASTDGNGDRSLGPFESEEEMRKFLQESIAAKEFAYSPYSKFRVGCCLLTDNNELIKGCNVENASLGLTLCAERTAIVKAVSMGYKKYKAVAISSDMKEKFITPCGACRQVMAEFGLEYDVFFVKPDGSYKHTTVGHLLPMAFTPQDLFDHGDLSKLGAQ